MFGASANLTNGIVGAGIMGLPFALKEAGFLLGLLLLLAVAWITDYSLRLLARLATAHAVESYDELVGRAFGAVGFVAVEVAQLAFAFGALVAYLLIIRDAASLVVRDIAGTAPEPHLALAVVAVVIVLPICFLPTMASLARFSAMSMVAVIVMVCVVLVERFNVASPSVMPWTEQYLTPHGNWLSAIGGFAFAFVCQHQLLLVLSSLRHPDEGRVATVVHTSLAGALLLSTTMAVAGYTLFFEHTEGDILRSFETAPLVPAGAASVNGTTPTTDPGTMQSVTTAVTVARVCLTVNMALTYPAELMVCRHVIRHLIDKYLHRRALAARNLSVFDTVGRAEVESELAASQQGWSAWAAHIGVTLALFVTSFGIALAVEDLGIVQELTGSISAVLLAFVFPAACHLRLGAHHDDATGPWHRSKIASTLLLLLGIAVFFAATAQTIVNAAEGEPPPSDDPAVG